MNDRDRLLADIRAGLESALGGIGPLQWERGLAGGDINRAALLADGRDRWFLKYHHAPPPGMFETEALALDEIGAQGCIRVPKPIAHGNVDDTGWLVLEYFI